MMKKLMILTIMIFILSLLSCNTTEPPINGKEITLKLEDVSCTEAWITLTTTNLQLPTIVTLLQDGKARKTIDVETKDSLLYIDSLLPNNTYTFQSTYQQINRSEIVSSNELSVTTMDTTSHNFTFETYTFGGQAGSCALYDVAIIDKNNIWAVGEIYLLDSLGQPDPQPYNLAVWDGKNWKLQKLTYKGFPPVIHTLFAINEQDVWLDPWLHWDGENFQEFPIDPVLMGVKVNKIWGNEDGIYVVGDNGFIAHRSTSGVWSKIESRTTTIINDIWGIINNQDKTVLYCPVSSFFVPGDKKILKITDDKVDSVSWNRDVRLYSGWTSDENFLYVCGEGAYVNKFGNWNQINLPAVGMNSVRGNDINDIFISGDFGFVTHFNGTGWITYNDLLQIDTDYYSVAVKDAIVVFAGRKYGSGIITVGRRN